MFEVYKQHKHYNRSSYIFIGVYFQTKTGSSVFRPWIFFIVLVCKPRFYNSTSDCTNRCGYCKNTAACDNESGHCLDGCELHFKYPYCQGTLMRWCWYHIKFLFINKDVFPSIKQEQHFLGFFLFDCFAFTICIYLKGSQCGQDQKTFISKV